ncbi:Lysozyme inhibitor N-terminal domain-containing protein [Desulfonema magnum]|uniref:Lysozyme inhibitor N-terminal domain-containing protein n=2 Tax=Desulfonema magnum TaxID=45655 RepID=A0A975BU08_9BACT|nr:Lysozyme inhibitor N-terminal domain-containing protein [Desulfonema magnum]
MLKNAIIFFTIFFFAIMASAFADQAAWIKKSDAYKAGGMINPGMMIREYCAPCNDAGWKVLTVKQVEVKNTADGQSYQVFLNGKGIDLAYTYIQKQGTWVNLAMLLGLDVSGVPESLPDSRTETSAAENSHLIDRILNECIARDSDVSANVANCIYEAYELWDAELNKVYNQLRVSLNPDQQKALKAAQLEWIRYRDLEFRLIDSIYSSLQGTMYKPMRAQDRMDIVKKRALELKLYSDLLKAHLSQ